MAALHFSGSAAIPFYHKSSFLPTAVCKGVSLACTCFARWNRAHVTGQWAHVIFGRPFFCLFNCPKAYRPVTNSINNTFFVCFSFLSTSSIAFRGQFFTQTPHPLHRLISIRIM